MVRLLSDYDRERLQKRSKWLVGFGTCFSLLAVILFVLSGAFEDPERVLTVLAGNIGIGLLIVGLLMVGRGVILESRSYK